MHEIWSCKGRRAGRADVLEQGTIWELYAEASESPVNGAVVVVS